MIINFITLQQHLKATQYTWVITGVAGFIGSNLLEFLLKLNQRVIGIDNFATGYKENIEEVLSSLPAEQQQRFTFHEIDIRDYAKCLNALKESDFVLHQAALGSVPRSIAFPEVSHDVNVNGFMTILRACRENQVKSLVYASSSSVYGDSPHLPKQEEHVGNPLSPYAASKYTTELYAEAFSRCYKMNIRGLRYFNVFGPRQNTKGPYAAVIPLWIEEILQGKPIYINGDGKTSRDFTFIENVIQANLLAALSQSPLPLHQVFNIAAGAKTTLTTLAETICEQLGGGDLKPIYRDFREGDVRHSLADIKKAEKEIGYQPTHSLYQGLELTTKWFQARRKRLG